MSVKSYCCKSRFFLGIVGIGFHFFFNSFGAKKKWLHQPPFPAQVSTQRRPAVRLPWGFPIPTAGRRNMNAGWLGYFAGFNGY